MVSGGLGATDVGNARAIGGYSREFFDRVRAYYLKEYGKGSEQVKDCADGFRFEPHVAELVFKAWLAEAPIPTHFQAPLASLVRHGNRIIAITLPSAKAERPVR